MERDRRQERPMKRRINTKKQSKEEEEEHCIGGGEEGRGKRAKHNSKIYIYILLYYSRPPL